ncbi:MAG: glycosyltransferase family 2 protein [Alphaproteobacteria bacterium]|nr:glycosyltransferase family 2 protein [Alphaproteobacteria bacterium]
MGAPRKTTDGADQPILSLVVPIYNERDGLEPLLERVEPVLDSIARPLGRAYEIIIVDDGSSDGSLAALVRHRTRNPAIKILSLSRNFGKDVALTAGIDHAAGAAVVPMDADLQDPPEVIPELFAKWLEGYDMVYATRTSRGADGPFKKLSAWLFYRVHNVLAEVDIPSDTGDFRLLDRRVVEALRELPERNRFMKGLFSWVGFRQCAVSYERMARTSGRSKWQPWRLWNFGLDGITSSSTAPLRVWTYVGLAIFVFALAYAAFLIMRTLIGGVDVPGYASLMVVTLFMGGMTLLTLGIVGEYLGRIYIEVKQRPLYLVRESHGLQPDLQALAPATGQEDLSVPAQGAGGNAA